jgi:thymidylate kinase
MDVVDRFDSCILLDIDQRTMAARLLNRTGGNDFGHTGDTLQATLERHTAVLAQWRRHGAVTVDATQPIDDVGQDVLLAAAQALLNQPPGP